VPRLVLGHRWAASQPALSISPLEIAQLPRLTFGGRVAVVNVPEDEQRIEALFDGETLLGFDSESRPTSAISPNNRIAIIQLATERCACLWRVGELKSVPPLLRRLLEDGQVHKVAQGATHELKSLQEEWGVSPQSFIDLHHIALSLRTTPRSLQGLVALFMKKRLGKEQRLSDWEQVPLTQEQIEYAAVDAWAARQVLLAMRRAYSTEQLMCERLLSSEAKPVPFKPHVPDPAAAALRRLQSGGSSHVAIANKPRTSVLPNASSGTREQEPHQKLAALCISQGYVLRFDGFESAPDGFRCVFKVEHRRQGRPVVQIFRSKRVHSAIRAAQNDAAAEALLQLAPAGVLDDKSCTG